MKKEKIEYYIPGKNTNRRKHYWWRYLLVLLLGQCLLISELIIGIGGVASSVSLETVLSSIQMGDLAGDDADETSLLTVALTFMDPANTPKKLSDLDRFIDSKALVEKLTTEGPLTMLNGLLNDDFYDVEFDKMGDYFMNEVPIAPVIEGLGVSLPSFISDSLLYDVPTAYIGLATSEIATKTITVGSTYDLTSEVVVLPVKSSIQDYSVSIHQEQAVPTSMPRREGEPSGLVLENEYIKITDKTIEAKAIGSTVIDLSQEGFSSTLTINVVNGSKMTKREGEPGGEGGTTPTATCENHGVDVYDNQYGLNRPNGYCDNCHELIKNSKTISGLLGGFGNILSSLTSFTVGDIMGLIGGESSSSSNTEPTEIPAPVDPNDPYGIGSATTMMEALEKLPISALMGGDILAALGPCKVGIILGTSSSDPMISSLADLTIAELTADDADLLKIVMGGKTLNSLGIDLTGNPLLEMIGDCCIIEPDGYGEPGYTGPQTATDLFNSLTIGDALGCAKPNAADYEGGETDPQYVADLAEWNENPAILKALADIMLNDGNIATTMSEKTIGDLLGFTKETAPNAILGELASCKLSAESLEEGLDNLKLSVVIGKEEMFNVDGDGNPTSLKGIWSLLFSSVSEAESKTINDMGSIMNNLGSSVLEKPLQELKNAGLIDVEQEKLDKPLSMTILGVPYPLNSAEPTKKLGEYSIVDLINVLGNLS